jgi:RsiW-degrading membrane proteinase PrsW (M82 family)
MVEPVPLVWPLLLAGAFGGGWLAYFRWKDKKHPEPIWIIVIAVVGGMLSVGGALLGFRLLESERLAPDWQVIITGSWAQAGVAALVIGLVEEAAKLAPVLVIASRTSRFDELLDGFVYAGSAAIGFAMVETVFLVMHGLSGVELVARAVTSPITHALLSAPAGLGVAYRVLLGRRWALPLGFFLSVLLHGGFDLLVARQPPVSALLVGAVWWWMLWATLKLEKVPPIVRAG